MANPFSKAPETDDEENWLSFSPFQLWLTLRKTRPHARDIPQGSPLDQPSTRQSPAAWRNIPLAPSYSQEAILLFLRQLRTGVKQGLAWQRSEGINCLGSEMCSWKVRCCQAQLTPKGLGGNPVAPRPIFGKGLKVPITSRLLLFLGFSIAEGTRKPYCQICNGLQSQEFAASR